MKPFPDNIELAIRFRVQVNLATKVEATAAERTHLFNEDDPYAALCREEDMSASEKDEQRCKEPIRYDVRCKK